MYKCLGGATRRDYRGREGGRRDVQLTGEESPASTSHQPHSEGESSGKTLACAQLYPL